MSTLLAASRRTLNCYVVAGGVHAGAIGIRVEFDGNTVGNAGSRRRNAAGAETDTASARSQSIQALF